MSHSSGGKVLAGWVPPGGSEGESVPRFSLRFSLAAAPKLPCVQWHDFDLCPTWHDLLPCVSIGLQAPLLFSFLTFILLHQVSVVACRLLSSCGVRAPEPSGSVAATRRLSCPVACGILVPWPGIKPVSPALEGRFLTTGPPGKSLPSSSPVVGF